MPIPNQYKDTLNDFIDISDPESPDQAESIDEKFRNALMSEGNSANLSEGDCLNENRPDRSLRLVPKTKDSQVHPRCVVAP